MRAPIFLLAMAAAPVGSGCKRETPSRCPVYRQITHLAPSTPGAVIAEVNGRPLLRSELEHRMRSRHLSRQKALQELVDEELLVQEAERRGLRRDPEVRTAGKQAAVYRLLRAHFEKEFTRASIPEAQLRKAYAAAAHLRYHRPQIRRFAHLFVDRPWARRGHHFHLDSERDRAIRQAMERLRARIVADAPRRFRDFQAYAKTPEARRLGVKTQAGTVARAELRPAFGKALFALDHRTQITGVIQTKPWYHIAYLVQIIPKTDIPYERARQELLDRLWPSARRDAFTAWLKTLRVRCPVRLHPENLPVSRLSTETLP